MATLQGRARLKHVQGENLYNAGWHNGEWTCAYCGAGYGKNLKGQSPFALAHQHVTDCPPLKFGPYTREELDQLICSQRDSLAQEIRETLSCRGYWVPKKGRSDSDLIMAVAKAIEQAEKNGANRYK